MTAPSISDRLEALERRLAPGAVEARERAARMAARREEAERLFAAETPARQKLASAWLGALADLDAALRSATDVLARVHTIAADDRAAAERQARAVALGGLDREVPAALWPPIEAEAFTGQLYQLAETRSIAEKLAIPARSKR